MYYILILFSSYLFKNIIILITTGLFLFIRCFLSISFTLVRFSFKAFKFLIKPKSLLFFFIYFVITYIMCPYIRRITIEGAFYSANYILDFFIFRDNKINFLAFLNLIQSSINNLFVGIKFAIYMVYKNAWSHIMLLNSSFLNYVVQPLLDFFNYIFNFFLIIFFKQFILVGNIASHIIVKNFSCMGKYYHVFVFILLVLIFTIVELQKNFFFLKKRLILSKKSTNMVFVSSFGLSSFYTFFKNKLFNS